MANLNKLSKIKFVRTVSQCQETPFSIAFMFSAGSIRSRPCFLLRLPLNHVVDIGHQASPDATLIFGASAKPLTRVFPVWVRLSSFSG